MKKKSLELECKGEVICVLLHDKILDFLNAFPDNPVHFRILLPQQRIHGIEIAFQENFISHSVFRFPQFHISQGRGIEAFHAIRFRGCQKFQSIGEKTAGMNIGKCRLLFHGIHKFFHRG